MMSLYASKLKQIISKSAFAFSNMALITLLCLLFAGNAAHSQQPTRASVSYGIVADNSGSMLEQLKTIVNVTKAIADSSGPDDNLFVTRFVSRDNIQRLQDLTKDKNAVIEAAEDLNIEPGNTAIIDAMYDSAQYLAQHNQADTSRGRALILITDGEDSNSRHTVNELLTLLTEKKIRVYTIGLVGRLKEDRGTKKYEKDVALLNQLSSQTNGYAFFPKKVAEFDEAVKEISSKLHNP
jgi:VWFA-related protein